MMKRLLALTFLLVNLKPVFLQYKILGNWDDVSVDQVQNALDFSIFFINNLIRSEVNYYKLNRVDKAQKQVKIVFSKIFAWFQYLLKHLLFKLFFKNLLISVISIGCKWEYL